MLRRLQKKKLNLDSGIIDEIFTNSFGSILDALIWYFYSFLILKILTLKF